MKTWGIWIARGAGIVALAMVVSACKTTPKFALPRYQRAPEHSTTLKPAVGKVVYVSPIIARLDSKNKRLIDSHFSPAAYLTDALEQELRAAGTTPVRTPFKLGRTLAGVESVIIEKANQTENAVYVSGEVLWFGPVDMYSGSKSGLDSSSETFQSRVTMDVTVHSAKGETLFAKRGFCNLLDSVVRVEDSGTHPMPEMWLKRPETSQIATQMALQQIIADPAFRKVLE